MEDAIKKCIRNILKELFADGNWDFISVPVLRQLFLLLYNRTQF